MISADKMQILRSIVDDQKYPLLFAAVSGAHLYGFPSPDSDFDLRGVHLLPLEEIVGLSPRNDTVESMKVTQGLELDLVTHEAEKFFRLMLKKNGYVLEQLLSPLVVYSRPGFEELQNISKDCLTRHHAHHYLGFSKTQWELFRKETPLRVKPLLYVYRVLLTGIHLMKTGQLEANLVTLNDTYQLPYLKDLIQLKLTGKENSSPGAIDLAFHEGEYHRLRAELEEASEKSKLPEAPSGEMALSDLLVRLRLGKI